MEYGGTHVYIHSMSLSKRLPRTASVLPRFDRLVIKMPRPEDVNMAHDTCLSWHACAERISTSTAVDCVNVPTGKMSSSRWYWCWCGVGGAYDSGTRSGATEFECEPGRILKSRGAFLGLGSACNIIDRQPQLSEDHEIESSQTNPLHES